MCNFNDYYLENQGMQFTAETRYDIVSMVILEVHFPCSIQVTVWMAERLKDERAA